MTDTKIDWAEKTWNPVTGCTPVSAGCAHCYAAKMASTRLRKNPQYAGLAEHGKWTGKVHLCSAKLDEPLGWKKPKRIFVCSMWDLFHEEVPFGFVMRMLHVMAHTPWHTYMIVTKRPERMLEFWRRWACTDGEVFGRKEHRPARGPAAVRKKHPSPRGELFAEMLGSMGPPPEGAVYPSFDWAEGMLWWPDAFAHLWLGVSVENQDAATARLPLLADTPAAVRFVSYEPALEYVDFAPWLYELDWLILGGESGRSARPCAVQWIDKTVDACHRADVPIFVKQCGTVLAKREGMKAPKGNDPAEWPRRWRCDWPREHPFYRPIEN